MFKKYRSIKIVSADEMSYHLAGQNGLIRGYDNSKNDEDGYRVIYDKGYESWSPKDVFEDGYIEIDDKE